MHSSITPVSALLLAIAFVQHAAVADALFQTYCSSENTGSGSAAKYWTWQSNGWCHDQCDSSYAFAIVQGNNCWCSNYAPADTTSVGDCSVDCPGFPNEQCGNEASGLFGYIALDKAPSGTQGAAGSSTSSAMVSTSQFTSARASSSAAISTQMPETSSSSAPPSSSSSQSPGAPETVFRTVTETPAPIVPSTIPTSSTTSTQPSVAPSTTTQAPSSSTSVATSWTPTPVTSVQVVTVSGSVVYKTVTGMSTAPAEIVEKKHSSSGGVIAGAVIGSLGGLALIGALLFWFLFWRQRQATRANDSEAAAKPPQRNTSTMSQTGLLGKSEKPPYPPVVTNIRRSSTQALDQSDSISPASDRRNSRPLFYDQRLNPSALMDLDNGSHTSIITIEDNRDYTRTLNIRNPDPPNP